MLIEQPKRQKIFLLHNKKSDLARAVPGRGLMMMQYDCLDYF